MPPMLSPRFVFLTHGMNINILLTAVLFRQQIFDKVRPEAGIVDLEEEERAEKKAGNEKFIWNK